MKHAVGFALLAFLLVGVLSPRSSAARGESELCEKDVKFALEALEKECGQFFKLKGINWKKVAKAFKKEAKKVRTPGEHFKLLVRLTARLRDGHAYVKKIGDGESIEWPDPSPGTPSGPWMFLCRVGKKVYVKNSFEPAQELGIVPGAQVLTLDELPALKWLEAKAEESADTIGFSTDHQAFFSACHWGLGKNQGDRLKIEFIDLERKKRKRTLSYPKGRAYPVGPAVWPKGLEGDRDVRYGRLESGLGYVHLRKCPKNLPERMDEALAALDDPDGLILDLRSNGGGGYDHEGLLGRFVPSGKSISYGKRYTSQGPKPYGGPVVVIIDGLTRSAGETTAAIFKEDGRAYLIGESPTAGMSSSKKTIELPSGLFAIYASVHSNMKRSNKGAGIEGIGIPPHEIVEYDPEDLAQGRDTLIRRAEALLQDFPRKKVPYDPGKFGWRR